MVSFRPEVVAVWRYDFDRLFDFESRACDMNESQLEYDHRLNIMLMLMGHCGVVEMRSSRAPNNNDNSSAVNESIKGGKRYRMQYDKLQQRIND